MDCNVNNPNLGQTYPERRIKHYSSFHKILLVGEGDFSFSSSLANAFGFAGNMVATSLDSREKVVSSYTSSPEQPCKSGQENLQTLERLGAMTLHGVDVRTMDKLDSLRERKFDRIVYNFPHAGFFGKEEDERVINMHRHLLKMFFENASTMLSTKGEIHVTHQERYPYNQWKLTEQAEECGLQLKESVSFIKWDYPGYTNRRGAGPNIGDTFGLGHCRTYMYIQRESIESLETAILKLESERQGYAKSLEAAIWERESERQASKAAEAAKVDMEALYNDLKTLADKAVKENSELERQRDIALYEKNGAWREKENIAKQLNLKEDEIKKTLLKLDTERQARKAAETAKAELEASLNHFKTLADKALEENSEFRRRMELASFQIDSARREKTNLANQLSLKEDEIVKERQARKAAETAKSELEVSFSNFMLSAIRQINQLERQRNDALFQKEEVCREKEKILREKEKIESKWKSYLARIRKFLAKFWHRSRDREMESRPDVMNV